MFDDRASGRASERKSILIKREAEKEWVVAECERRKDYYYYYY